MNKWDWIYGLLILFLMAILLWGVLEAKNQYEEGSEVAVEWQCIEPVEGMGWSTYCEVGDCHILFYGDDFRMECE